MNLSAKEILRRLGAGESIETVCQATGLTRSAFDAWWRSETEARVPDPTGTRRAGVRSALQIERDAQGVPHIYADNDTDLFFGFGYALAQDRLFQLDYLRRRGAGRLAEVLGPLGTELDLFARTVGFQNVLELDILARTVGLRRIALAEWDRLDPEVRALVTAFTHGINAHLEETRDRLPIEFDLLDYRPEAWEPVDCLTVEAEFRWYLTGRFPVLVMPELAKRTLGDGPLYRAFLETESDTESILPPGTYPRGGSQKTGEAAGDPEGAVGSNNWVVSGARSSSGKPMVASDPHVPFDAVSCWYQVHLCGGSFNVAGMAYVGIPAVMFGRNERVAWGCTNNICSQRDLYLEKTDPAHPDCFLHDGRWEPARTVEDLIPIKGAAPHRLTICFSRNGPIVTDVLPPPARTLGPVALKWLGATEGGWLTALLAMDRAPTAQAYREATRPWHVPTFNMVFADVDGHIGYQATGRIPIRTVWERGFRPGWDPRHQWAGLIPFEGMPRWDDPARGWIATANNRVAPNDFAYPLSGTWSDGVRAGRIRQMIEAQTGPFRLEDFVRMHADALSLRAARCVPHLLRALASSPDARVQAAARHLQSWNYRMDPDQVGPTIWAAFFSNWTKTVVQQRFEGPTAALLAGGAAGLSAALLAEDRAGWLAPGQREAMIQAVLAAVVVTLTERLGPDLSTWTWGRVHTMPMRHLLSGRGDLARLLDYGGMPVQGDLTTVCNTGLGGKYEARSGASYRLIADLASAPPALWAVDAQGSSGHRGSRHYGDQLEDWLQGRYHRLSLVRADAGQGTVARLCLEP
jgi:penicillin amidase